MKLLLVRLPNDDEDEDDGDDDDDNNDDHDDDHYNGDDENDIDNTNDNLYVDEMPLERFPPFCEQGIVGNGSICTGKEEKTDI